MTQIDEKRLQDLMAGGEFSPVLPDKPEGLPEEKKEMVRRKKGQQTNYNDFLKPTSAPNGKRAVYITHENHKIISSIVNVSGNIQLSLGSYVDNVLKEHFELYKDEINRLFNENKPSL